MLKKLGRLVVLIVAVLVIVLSLGGIVGAWGFARVMSDVTVKVFSVVQTGVGVVDTAVGRVATLIETARSEVQQTGETVTTAAGNLQENKPVLTALNERLETRLGPTVDNIQGALAPVHDALVKVDNAVSLANSIPFIQERAPRLEQLDQTLTQLSGLAADVQQLRTTLRTAVTGETDQLTQGVATALTDLTSRIDSRLADTQTNLEELQSEIAALQARIQKLQSRLLTIYNLIALAATLLFLWVIYSQIVVIRHHWSRSSPVTLTPAAPEQGAATVSGKTDAETPLEIDEGEMAPQTVAANGETPSAEAMPDQPAESTDSKA
jgi:uncharacterized phage infection (PIP) family protein YhgE